MGNLVLSRKPGESIEVYDPADPCFGHIIITQGRVGSGKSSIAIDAPRNLMVKRSELVGKEADILSENKYYSLGLNPLAAIAALGFTREVSLFGFHAYQHDTLPLDMRHEGSQRGWVCVVIGDRVGHPVKSLESLKDYMLTVAFDELKKRGAK